MHTTSPIARRLAIAAWAVLALAAAGAASAAKPNAYTATNLVSNGGVPAPHTDLNLRNGWGVAFNPAGFVWVANNGSGTSTLYDGNGVPQSLVVALPSATGVGAGNPTGIVYNGSADFAVSKGARRGASIFLFANEDGSISGWSPSVDGTNAIRAVTPGADAPIYKGLAIAANADGNHLYAADFKHARVDVFDKSFAPVAVAGGFVDATLPAGYAPFGIQAIQGKLIVTYARQVAGSGDEKDGAGLGFVDEFDADGRLIHRVASHKGLNAPWGIAFAPSNFGPFSGMLLVGNFGDGTIAAFTTSAKFAGYLNRPDGSRLVIPGLWGMQFGNGLLSQPTNTLFFAAGPNDEADGVYGSIRAATP
jgi:uncharacterized protein (TIGR03118 family)